MRYNQYTLHNMVVYCIHAKSFMAFTVCTYFSLQTCKTKIAKVVHIFIACSKTYSFL